MLQQLQSQAISVKERLTIHYSSDIQLCKSRVIETDTNFHHLPTTQSTTGSHRILAMDTKGSLSHKKYLNSIDQTAVPDVEWVHDEQENDSLKGSLQRVPEDEYDEQ